MINVVPAKTNDVLVIHTLAQEIWKNTYKNILSKNQIDFMLDDMYSVASILDQMENSHHFLLLVDDLEFVGFASFSETSEAKIYKIQKLYLHPDIQGKGAGRLMVSHISQLILEMGGDTVELNVNRNNPATDFYLKLGFKIFKSVDIPYYQFVLNDYIMQKSITKPIKSKNYVRSDKMP